VLNIITKSSCLEELGIMAHFARQTNCVRALEIGTLTGSWCKYMSDALPDTELHTIDIVHNNGARDHCKGLPVNFHEKGSDAFFAENDLMFDFVFIDGDHTYAQSKKDLDNVVKCLSPRGIVVLHDITKSKHAKKQTCARTFKEFNHPEFCTFLVKTNRNLGVIWHRG